MSILNISFNSYQTFTNCVKNSIFFNKIWNYIDSFHQVSRLLLELIENEP